MRLRHKTGAENDILNYNMVIKNKNYPLKKFRFLSQFFYNIIPKKNYFHNNNELELELGIGKGSFICKSAIKNQKINYIGIEKSATILLKAINNYNNFSKTRDLSNLLFLCEDIKNLKLYFKPNSINKIYLNFSDPWPKKRHSHRRLTHSKFLNIYYDLLKENGTIEFKTDNKNLFHFSIDEFSKSKFKLTNITYDLHNSKELNSNNIMTEYEKKFSERGNTICKLVAIKKLQ